MPVPCQWEAFWNRTLDKVCSQWHTRAGSSIQQRRRYSAYERELLGIVWAIGKWRHYFEGHKFIVQTDHSSLRHLPNQPSVNRRIWKWVSILQGYDMEIRHILGKVNPADTIIRQVKFDDAEYTGQVKKLDQELVDMIRIPSNATDKDIQTEVRSIVQ